jgi:hypothetical protein
VRLTCFNTSLNSYFLAHPFPIFFQLCWISRPHQGRRREADRAKSQVRVERLDPDRRRAVVVDERLRGGHRGRKLERAGLAEQHLRRLEDWPERAQQDSAAGVQ